MHEITTNLHEHEGVEDQRVVLILQRLAFVARFIRVARSSVWDIEKIVALEEKYKADSQLEDCMTFENKTQEMSTCWK